MVLWVESPHLPSLTAAGLAEEEDYVLSFSCGITKLHSQRVMWLHGFPVMWVYGIIRHHPANSGGVDLVEKEILSFQFDTEPIVITWSELCDSTMGFASPYVNNLQSLVVIHLLKEEIFRFSLSRELMSTGD